MLEVERASLEVRRNFFHVRAAVEWNKLPEVVKTQKTLNGFKAAYDAWRNGKLPTTKQTASAASEEHGEKNEPNRI